MIARVSLCIFVAGTLAQAAIAQPSTAQAEEKVLGIGGVFFRARDPQALAQWYEKHLGITRVPTDYETQPWMQLAGPTVFAPFSSTRRSIRSSVTSSEPGNSRSNSATTCPHAS